MRLLRGRPDSIRNSGANSKPLERLPLAGRTTALERGYFGSKETNCKAEDSEEPGDCQPAFLELSFWYALPKIIRVTGSLAFFGSIHQQRHVAQRKKSTRGEYRMSARSTTLTLSHSGQRVRANAIRA